MVSSALFNSLHITFCLNILNSEHFFCVVGAPLAPLSSNRSSKPLAPLNSNLSVKNDR